MSALLILAGALFGSVALTWSAHLRRLKRHQGLSREDFVGSFRLSGVSPRISGAVYDHFKKLGFWTEFRPSPTDSLEGTYKTVDEDVESNLEDVLRSLGLDLPHSGILQEWNGPIETLSDVVRWADWVSTKQNVERK